MNEIEKATLWFFSRGINAKKYDDTVMIEVQEYDVLISTSEVLYRAELYDEENPS